MKTARVHHAARRRRRRGRSRRARSSRRSCRPSGSWARARRRLGSHGSPLLCSGCANSAGSRVAHVAIEYRWAEGRSERFAEIAAEFVRLKVDVIVTSEELRGPSRQSRRHRSSRSCLRQRRTRSAAAWSRAWRDRAATSPACRSSRADLAGKRLELLREVVPGLRRLAIMANVGNPRRRARDGRGSGRGPHARPRSHHARNPASGGYRARLRSAQGPRGRTLCRCRPARRLPTGFASTPWRSARDCRRCTLSGSMSKREV